MHSVLLASDLLLSAALWPNSQHDRRRHWLVRSSGLAAAILTVVVVFSVAYPDASVSIARLWPYWDVQDLHSLDLPNRRLHFPAQDARAGDACSDRTLSLDLSRRSYERANLSGSILCNVILANATLTGAHLVGTQLQGAHLTGAVLREADLTNANLQSADLTGAELQGAVLRNAELQDVTARPPDWEERVLEDRLAISVWRTGTSGGADRLVADAQERINQDWAFRDEGLRLQGADLYGAELQNADLPGAQLQGANLQYTDPPRGEPHKCPASRSELAICGGSRCGTDWSLASGGAVI